MKRQEGYYWVRWGDNWYISIWGYDDEDSSWNWYCNGMCVIPDPDEIDERRIERVEQRIQRNNDKQEHCYCVTPDCNTERTHCNRCGMPLFK